MIGQDEMVRIAARGKAGELILEGQFSVLHKGFVATSRICLTLGDESRRVLLEIPFGVLEEVDAEPPPKSMRAAAQSAESRVLDRLAL